VTPAAYGRPASQCAPDRTRQAPLGPSKASAGAIVRWRRPRGR